MEDTRERVFCEEKEDRLTGVCRFVDFQVPMEEFIENGLDEFFEVTATATGLKGREYLLAAKLRSNPYYFVQMSSNKVVSQVISQIFSPSWYSVVGLKTSKKVVNYFAEFVEKASVAKPSHLEGKSIPEIRKYKTFDLGKILNDDSLGHCYFDMLK